MNNTFNDNDYDYPSQCHSGNASLERTDYMLGWFNAFLLLLLLSFPIAIEVNKRWLKGKNKNYNHFLKNGRKIHPYVGGLLILTGLTHGFLKLGRLDFHTGSLLLMFLVFNGFLALLYKRTKKRYFAKIHRYMGALIVLLFLLHYLRPWYFN